MKYALFIVEQPADAAFIGGTGKWPIFLAEMKQHAARREANFKAIGVGAYQFDLSGGLFVFGTIVTLAQQNGLATRTMFFEAAPEWIHDKSD